MKQFSKFRFAQAGLSCALLGASLAGCNQNNSSGGVTGASTASSSDTLATVGTSKVTRADLATFLEAQSGEQALPLLIETQLIFEALKAQSLEVTDAEIEADLAKRQVEEPQLVPLLAGGGARLNMVKVQIKRELATQKLLTAGITATDAQVKSFFEKNRRYYDQSEKVKVGILLASTKTRADLMARQLKEGSKTFAALVAEQKKANDPIAGQSTEERDGWESLDNFPPNITSIITKLPKGGTSAPQSLNTGTPAPVFVIFRKVDVQTAQKADLTKIRAEVEADYKNAEVAKKTIETARKAAESNPQIPRNPSSFDENLRRSYESVKAQNPKATLSSALNFINQSAAAELLAKLRTAGTVQIEDAAYAKVAAVYQAPNAATGTGNTATGNTATGNAAAGNAAAGNAATGNAATGAAPAAP